MGFFDFIFKKKEEVVEEVIEKVPETHSGIICDRCGEEIFQHEPRKKISNETYHRKCFKKLKKEAMKVAFG